MGFAVAMDHLYPIVEYVKRLNLDDVIFSEENQKLDVGKMCTFSLQIAQAVAYLYNQKPAVVHCDIKPDHIIISENADVVKLCDMGLSKLNILNSTLTTFANQNGLQPGTPAYQAPEVILNHSPACKSTDVWSLPCTISEVFSEEQERDKLYLTRTVIFQLVQALKYKISLPDENFLLLVQYEYTFKIRMSLNMRDLCSSLKVFNFFSLFLVQR
ncbi:mitogen-activated protein kinase mpk-1-like [Mercenaria mercenaria]|uniref:mitogen-activated protein kinase mpk-1-like n=1 Tax=Mercenaria mercenaria TaxID=6596 RepID=UPI00234F0ED3|nr:mitogen-activated protein kinase mpk-1-like [Mercenaria mercenaria]